MTPDRVTVVVPIENPADPRVALTIDSIDLQTIPGDELIAIGEFSNDQWWNRNGVLRRRRVESAGELRRGDLLNKAVVEARNSIILVCAPDCLKIPRALDQARNAAEGRPLLGLTVFLGRLPTERRLTNLAAGLKIPKADYDSLYTLAEDDTTEYAWMTDNLAIHKRDLRRVGGFCAEFSGQTHRDGCWPDLLERLARIAPVRVNRHMRSIHLWHPTGSQAEKDQQDKAERLLNMRREERKLGEWNSNPNYRRAV
jgi:hypothetical protein